MVLLILPAFGADKQKDEETLRHANLVLQDMLNSKNIPPDLLSKADCVLILPGVKKFGFGVGGSGGRGPLLCRTGQNFDGRWSAPAMYSVGGASVGLQVGGSSTDFVLLLMNEKVVNQVLTAKTKMGTDATTAAGPGATAPSASHLNERRSGGQNCGKPLLSRLLLKGNFGRVRTSPRGGMHTAPFYAHKQS